MSRSLRAGLSTVRQRVLICGSRDYPDEGAIFTALRGLFFTHGIEIVMHGAARGADLLARNAAQRLGVRVVAYPADWRKYGRAAGVLRNQSMIDHGKPTVVLAFNTNGDRLSRGTADMVRRARAADIPVLINPQRGRTNGNAS